MRALVAVVMSLGTLLLGVWGISQEAQSVQPQLDSQAANQSHTVATRLFEGVGGAGAEMLPWMGVGAVILIALGFLVVVGRGGGR